MPRWWSVLLVAVLAIASSAPLCGSDRPATGDGGPPPDDGPPADDADPPPTDAGIPLEPLCTDAAGCPGHVTIIHAWGITNPAPYLYDTGHEVPTHEHCEWTPVWSCTRAVEGTFPAGEGPNGRCCATTGGVPACSGHFAGGWHAWIRDWWLQGWLPSIGVSPSEIRRAYVIYNRNGFWGGPHHSEDCEAITQLQQALYSAYRQCDSHVVVTTHSNGGVTFLWGWREFIERGLVGPDTAQLEADRVTTCTAKGRNLPGGITPPLFVNAHLMQAAVGDGSNPEESPSDFIPLHPYDTHKDYWEPRNAAGHLRALLGIRFYYNHEDVMTYDYSGASSVGRNEVLRWLDGTFEKSPAGAGFWQGRTGQAPFVALHACGHTSSHSASMGAENGICGDLVIRNVGGAVTLEQSCANECDQMQDWYDSAQGPGRCVNPCHRNCFGPTALTAIQITDVEAPYPDKFPFSYGNRNLRAMTATGGQQGWLDNRMRLDWSALYDRQVVWCQQPSPATEQEPYANGVGPKFGPLLEGRNDLTGQVPL